MLYLYASSVTDLCLFLMIWYVCDLDWTVFTNTSPDFLYYSFNRVQLGKEKPGCICVPFIFICQNLNKWNTWVKGCANCIDSRFFHTGEVPKINTQLTSHPVQSCKTDWQAGCPCCDIYWFEERQAVTLRDGWLLTLQATIRKTCDVS